MPFMDSDSGNGTRSIQVHAVSYSMTQTYDETVICGLITDYIKLQLVIANNLFVENLKVAQP